MPFIQAKGVSLGQSSPSCARIQALIFPRSRQRSPRRLPICRGVAARAGAPLAVAPVLRTQVLLRRSAGGGPLLRPGQRPDCSERPDFRRAEVGE